MLLETLDIKVNDIIIYSQNKFEPENNFKIIFKDDPYKRSKSIKFEDVCKFINEFAPKNMIVYRLLTNLRDFQIVLSKYGFQIFINGIKELIYFDPIYALKELENYTEAINYYNLRFRIQQVGLTTLNRMEELPNYAEIYHIDLEATEAQFQNDKAFVDALLANRSIKKKSVSKKSELDISIENKNKEKIDGKSVLKPRISGERPVQQENEEKIKNITILNRLEQPGLSNENSTGKKDKHKNTGIGGIRFISHDIAEDKDFDYREIMKVGMATKKKSDPLNQAKSGNHPELKNNSKIISDNTKNVKEDKGSLKSFFNKKQNIKVFEKNKKNEGKGEPSQQLIEIFKSPESLNNFLDGKQDKKAVLRMHDKK